MMSVRTRGVWNLSKRKKRIHNIAAASTKVTAGLQTLCRASVSSSLLNRGSISHVVNSGCNYSSRRAKTGGEDSANVLVVALLALGVGSTFAAPRPSRCESEIPSGFRISEVAKDLTGEQNDALKDVFALLEDMKKSGEEKPLPSSTATEEEDDDEDDEDDPFRSLPVYTLSDVSLNNGEDGRPIWMTYGGYVYDVTDFILNHPGGSEKILLAAGASIEPFWNMYRQHFASDLPMKLLEKMIVGNLDENEQEQIDDQMTLEMDENDPYKNEPVRHPSLIVHGDQPMNAEVPKKILTQSYITPNELFYIRNHHPVPHETEETVKEAYVLTIDLSALGRHPVSLTLEDLKALPKYEVVSTLQCSGNRRGNFNEVKRTSGTSWEQGAISTAKWGGPKLHHILTLAGLDLDLAEELNLNHVRFETLDSTKVSIQLQKAANPFGDCILAYEMNGEPLPPDHGYPVRSIVPGYCAIRNAKWVSKIELAETEAEGTWQRGLNYKVLPSGVTDAKSVDLRAMPSLQEASVFSGITELGFLDADGAKEMNVGDEVRVRASGWAWAGGGRNIVRLDLTGDNGKTWSTAEITQGQNQKFNRAWAWVFWEGEVTGTVRSDRTVEICSKSTDAAINVQPEKCDHMWNVRGLANNSWFRSSLKIDS